MSRSLVATVLVDNAESKGFCSEWGLSVHISYGGTNLLLDFGQSDRFSRNARILGIDLNRVDYAVLSHAHYDHANGMEAFFAHNTHAPLYLSAACDETCWSTKGGTVDAHYIGIAHGLLSTYATRLTPVPTKGVTTIAPGVHLVPHSTTKTKKVGQRAGMLVRHCNTWLPDDFSHEMSLVFEIGDKTSSGLAVFSSCSHAGLDIIASEVQMAFPNQAIVSFVGGLHLKHADSKAILHAARTIELAGIEHLYTGHCTGDRALQLLAQELPGQVATLYPGLVVRM